jgi:hypothetical protein
MHGDSKSEIKPGKTVDGTDFEAKILCFATMKDLEQ